MDEQSKQMVIYFLNGRMVKLPAEKIRYAHMGSQIDEEYTPDTSGGCAVINWDNVCFVREWVEPDDAE